MAANPNLRFIASQLRQLSLFARMTPDQLDRVATIAQLMRADTGTVLVWQGQPAQQLIMLVSGTAALIQRTPQGYEQQVGTIGEGQHTGEDALYSDRAEPYTLRVVESAVVLVVPKAPLAALIFQTPEIRANIGMQQTATREQVSLFKGQRPDESVMHIFKRHWWAFVRRLWLPIGISALLLLGAAFLAASVPWLAMLMFGAAVLIPGAVAFLLYADWQDDCLIITDQRLVKISDTFLQFEKTVNEVPFERAHEVNAEIPPDPFARVFRYGTVTIKTAGAAGTITIDTLPNPSKIQKLIFSQRDTYRQNVGFRSQEMINRDIDAALGIPNAQMQTPAPARRADGLPEHRPTSSSANPFRTRYINADGATVYRRHISIWLRHVSPGLLLVFGGIALAIASPFIPALRSIEFAALAAAFSLVLVGAFWAYIADWDWRHDMLIVGKETVMLIHKRPFWLQNDVEQIRLAQVDNVISEVIGLLNTLLNRGDIRISLIGGDAQDAKRFAGVGDPQSVQGEISNRLAELQAAQQSGALDAQREAFAQYLAAYHQRAQAQTGYAPVNPPYPPANAPYPPTPTPDTPQAPVRDSSRPPKIPRRQ
jgi:membrane protein YdbS with pleckstrin-like domain